MAGANNFLTFNENYSNLMSDVNFLGSTTRLNGATDGIAQTILYNKLFRQTSVMAAAIAGAMASKNIDMLDSDLSTLVAALSKLQTDDEVDLSIAAQVIPSGTKMVFFQSAAPSGWTLDTTHNDKALRVVSSSGGGSGGTHDLSSPPSLAHVHTGPSHTHTGPSHTHATAGHALTAEENGPHTHVVPNSTYGTGGTAAAFIRGTDVPSPYIATTSSGSGTAHNHGDTGAAGTGATGASGTANTGSTNPTAFAPKYVDVIICTRN